MENNNHTCSFCHQSVNDDLLVKGIDDTYICKDCIETAYESFNPTDDDFANGQFKLLKPSEIYQRLNEYVIGQDEAKKSLAVAVYNHYKRIHQSDMNKNGVEIQKSNLLLLGPTGSGKTYLAKTLAKILDVPFAIADATSMTEAGYVGEDVEVTLSRLVEAANGDIEKAKRGIVYIDEIDKLCTSKDVHGADISGEGVQQALLKLIEGTEATIPNNRSSKMPFGGMMSGKGTIDTTNILFICGGAFDGLEKIVQNRKEESESSNFGFNSVVRNKQERKTLSESFSDLETSDLAKYGMIPELAGRLPIMVCLDDLTEDDMVKILTEPKNALLKQYKELFAYDHIDLQFTDSAIRQIAAKASKRKTGARGLRTIIEKSMKDLMFIAPDQEGLRAVIVSEDVINGTKQPEYKYATN